MSNTEKASREDHIIQHKELHLALRELTGDYLFHHPKESASTTTIIQVLEWSYNQTTDPDVQMQNK